MSDLVNIDGLDKAEVLAALYNETRAVGLGHLRDVGAMTAALVRTSVKPEGKPWDWDFDYFFGRPLKVDLGGNTFDPRLYDHNAGGDGTAARVIAELRERGQR